MSDRRFSRRFPSLLAGVCVVLLAGASSGVPAALGQTGGPGSTDAPLTLPEAVARALARAPEVAAAQAESDLAGSSARLARAHASGPQAFVGTTPGYFSGLPVFVAGQVPSLFNLSVRQPLYDTEARAASSTACADVEERQSALERARSETARAVVLAYARVASDDVLLAGARRAVEAQEAMARRVSALAAEGRVTAVDADSALLEVARAKQRVLDRAVARDLDELELQRLLDWPAGTPLKLAGDALASVPPPPPSGNLVAARSADQTARSLEREIESLRSAADARTRTLQPSVIAEAQYLRLAKYNHFEDYFLKFQENDFTIGVSIQFPIWTGGRNAELGASARARVARAEAALRGRAKDLEISVRRTEADLTRASAAEGVARSAEAIARDRARIASALAAEGRGDADGAELADLALIRAQEELANATTAVLAARVSLLDLRGELVPRFAPATAAAPTP